jgi:hypothetical protein
MYYIMPIERLVMLNGLRRMCNEAVMACFKILPHNSLGRIKIKKTPKNLSKDRRPPCQETNLASSEHESRALVTQ